jgi:hypothetical protein
LELEVGPQPPVAERQSVRRQKRGAAAVKAKDWTDEELDRMSDAAKRRGTRPPPRWTPATGGWTAAQVRLLGTDHDEVIAKQIGKRVGAVRVKRVRLKIPMFWDRRRCNR